MFFAGVYRMTRSTLPFAAAVAMAVSSIGSSTGAAAGEVQIPVSGPLIELTVSESVSSTPDVVNLSAGVNALAPTASLALSQNAERMARVIAAIEGQGVAERDIRTSEISLNPQYEWDEGTRRQFFRGYQVSSTVQIRLRELPHTGRVLDAIVTAGADEVGAISWSVDDPSTAQQQAREAAFAAARERALGFARQAGYADVRLLEVSEGTSGYGSQPPMPMNAAVETRNMTMPIRPGQVQTGVTISVKFKYEPF
jgi:uncharacterized protein